VFSRLPLPRTLRPALGGLAVGAICLIFSVKALGSGHGYLQVAIDTSLEALGRDQILILMRGFLVLALLKIVVTSLTIGSGGSGGVFGPSLLIGGLTGAGIGCGLAALFPGMGHPPLAAFVVLGMAGFFAGVANAPIGSVIMVSEMTGSYGLLAPLLLVCVINVLLNRRFSLYESQIENRFASPAHKRLMITDLLGNALVANYFHPAHMPTIDRHCTARDLKTVLADEDIPFPLTVVDAQQTPCGIITMGTLRSVYFQKADEGLFLVEDMATPLVTCTPEESLASALRKFEKHGYSRLPVVDSQTPSKLLGYISYQDLMKAYEQELRNRRMDM